MIAVAIVAMLIGISVPVMDNVTRADLRAAASKTTGMVKATYDMAVLSGKPCRLMFDFKANTITAEQADSRLTLTDSDMKSEDEDEENKKKPSDRKAHLAAMANKALATTVSVKKNVTFQRMPGTTVFELPSGIKISGISAEHLKNEEKEGKVSIFFFPMGYCEHAVVTFEDTSQRIFSVEIEPLTGRTKITDKRIELKEER